MSRTLQEHSFRASVIHLYQDDGSVLEVRIYQNGSLTHKRLYNMCPLSLDFSPQNTPWSIFILNDDASTGQQLADNEMNMAPGQYIILAPALEPVWEMDFPDGDMMREMIEEPYTAARMEVELFGRLGPGEGVD
ncbi:hypothetical protein EMCG_03643 [[Emmonsia] crescens]|uniref:Uncharacterized protein n=1 Tax=[Emmonsia] crescens TaxID=73230 RepID=A0A0G2IZY5_9EURO|nr:hypothetical protein EMCG_03643 [Emmonsia crescens UAMH 3008]